MNQSAKYRFDEVPDDYIPSGLYVCPPLMISTVTVANPHYVSGSPLELSAKETGTLAATGLADIVGSHPLAIVSADDLDVYAHTVTDAARRMQELNYGLTLCPLRGARMPSVQVSAMCDNAEQFRKFDFGGGAQGLSDDRIVDDLCNILDPGSTGDIRRFAILDTAKGGDGSCHLANLLSTRVFPRLGGSWEAHFHLLHADDQSPNTSAIYGYRSKRASFTLNAHPVRSLLVEDNAALLGYDLRRDDDSGYQILNYAQGGFLAVTDEAGTSVYKSARLDEGMIELVGRGIGRVLDDSDEIVLKDPNYWQQVRDRD